jgi:hypothetical protein
MKRITIAAIVGGVIVFVWSAVAHMLLPLGEMGVSILPNEAPFIAALRGTKDGLYFFPGIDMSRKPTPEEQKAWEAKIAAGPTGILVYNQKGEAMSARQLGSEFGTNVLAAAISAWIASLLAAAYGRRVLAITLLGLFGWVSLILSYWIWYGFPAAYVLGEGITEVVGWLLAGLAIAKIVPRAGAAG